MTLVPGRAASPTLLLQEQFLDPASCASCCAALHDGDATNATIANRSGETIVDDRIRRTRIVSINGDMQQLIRDRLQALRPHLERYFDVSLAELQEPNFLLYRRGDFFRPHQDTSALGTYSVELQRRQISAVLFLNGQATLPAPGRYCGGELKVYSPGNITAPYTQIRGAPGLLVAFPSDTFHEVRPVVHGERCTVAAWYARANATAD